MSDRQRAGFVWTHRALTLVSLCLLGFAISVSAIDGKVGDIVWDKCKGNETLSGAECGYVIVPLDYFNTSAGVAKIALGRYNATTQPRKGSVFINPGGPGGPGVVLATGAGEMMQKLIGEDYDVIGFDPRGIGDTEPKTRCFPSPEARTAFIANTVLDRGYDVSPNLTDPGNRYHLIQTQRDAFALYQTQFEICGRTQGEQLRYMGTSTVVRDIDHIATLLDGNSSLINFYGLSYGSIMGQYLVNMFPDRVGRVVIDGVVNADPWANKPSYTWYRTWTNSSNAAERIFFDECAQAGPSNCTLAKKDNESGSDILARVEEFVAKLYSQPLGGANASVPTILTSGRARLFLLKTLEQPQKWPDAASALDQAMQGNVSAILNAVNTQDTVDLERSAVSCNDNNPSTPPTPEQVVDEGLSVEQQVSRYYFADVISEPDSGCQFWPVTPPERFLGPWNHTLKNPILIISNTADPSTPLVEGEAVHQTLGNSSALLVYNAPGHTSIALISKCVALQTRAFFANGTLPTAGITCQPTASPFSPSQDSDHGSGLQARTLNAAEKDLFLDAHNLRRLALHVLGP